MALLQLVPANNLLLRLHSLINGKIVINAFVKLHPYLGRQTIRLTVSAVKKYLPSDNFRFGQIAYWGEAIGVLCESQHFDVVFFPLHSLRVCVQL